MRALPIFLFLCILILGCTAPESSTEKASPTPQNTQTQTPIQTTPKPVETPITTPLATPSEDLGIDNIEKDLNETEQMLSELETLENVSFDI
jgi:PBP1b-binding outer membrane lipoprotein LpoB